MNTTANKTRDGKRDYLQVARALRDKLDGLISGVTDLGTQRKVLVGVAQELDLVLAKKANNRQEEISTCTHSCCEHEQLMNPALWSTLPKELLQRVFARLPFPNICRLKSLSKEWKESLEASSSGLNLALREASSSILARVTWDMRSNFWEHVLDVRTNRCLVLMNGAADAVAL